MIKSASHEIVLEIIDKKVELSSLKKENLLGKIITIDLTKSSKGKGCEAKFKVSAEGDSLIGKICFFGIYPSYIKRSIGRNISIIESSDVCEAKDAKIRIKPFLITRRIVHKSIRSALRKECLNLIKKFVSAHNYCQVFQAIISSSLQHSLSKKLKKIYPLAVCEIRVAKVEKFLEEKPKTTIEAENEAEIKREETAKQDN